MRRSDERGEVELKASKEAVEGQGIVTGGYKVIEGAQAS